jgi:hypothetical protein
MFYAINSGEEVENNMSVLEGDMGAYWYKPVTFLTF